MEASRLLTEESVGLRVGALERGALATQLYVKGIWWGWHRQAVLAAIALGDALCLKTKK